MNESFRETTSKNNNTKVQRRLVLQRTTTQIREKLFTNRHNNDFHSWISFGGDVLSFDRRSIFVSWLKKILIQSVDETREQLNDFDNNLLVKEYKRIPRQRFSSVEHFISLSADKLFHLFGNDRLHSASIDFNKELFVLCCNGYSLTWTGRWTQLIQTNWPNIEKQFSHTTWKEAVSDWLLLQCFL